MNESSRDETTVCMGCGNPCSGKQRVVIDGELFCCRLCHDENYIAEEVQVCNVVDELREKWEKMILGVDTCYTFQGQMGLEILYARREIERLKRRSPDAAHS